MVYSKTKPYNKTGFKGAADPSYDRYLKEAVNAGKAENVKESELEKPYNVKQTYGTMQQDYNPILPPVIEWPDLPGVIPGITVPVDDDEGIIPVGTGGLNCIWTSTGCEQLVGCWAGSDIVLEGPEAATAGYMPVIASVGEIVKQTISGAGGRGIELVLNPSMPSNSFTVYFHDGNGKVYAKHMDITCDIGLSWQIEEITGVGTYNNAITACVDSLGHAHIFSDNGTKLAHITWNGLSYSVEELSYRGAIAAVFVDGSDYLHVAYDVLDLAEDKDTIVYATNASGSWVETTVHNLGTVGSGTSVVLLKDSSNYLHIVYRRSDNRIYHVTNSSGSWVAETVITPAGSLAGGISAVIKASDTIELVYVERISNTNYLKYTSGTFGSWAASTTIASGTAFYDNLVLRLDSSEYKHIITSLGSVLTEYVYISSWQATSIAGSTPSYRYPKALIQANIIYSIVLEAYAGNYRLRDAIKNTTWELPNVIDTGYSGLGDTHAIVYNSKLNSLHIFFKNLLGHISHGWRYL